MSAVFKTNEGAGPATRTAATIVQYRKAYATLCTRMAGELGRSPTYEEAVSWFVRGNGRWSASTVRSYAAALAQLVRDAQQRGMLTDDRAATLSRTLETARPTVYDGSRRGASRKRKTCGPYEIECVRKHLLRGTHPDDGVVAGLLLHGAVLGLRPSEWGGAELHVDVLVVANGKATNGRACGSERRLVLGPLYASPAARKDLAQLCGSMRGLLRDTETRRKVLGRLAARLHRACEAVGVRRLSLYSLRHIALATFKKGLTAAAVAAVAGHGSDRTATTHYARRRSGWRLPAQAATPCPATLARVRITGRDRRRMEDYVIVREPPPRGR